MTDILQPANVPHSEALEGTATSLSVAPEIALRLEEVAHEVLRLLKLRERTDYQGVQFSGPDTVQQYFVKIGHSVELRDGCAFFTGSSDCVAAYDRNRGWTLTQKGVEFMCNDR